MRRISLAVVVVVAGAFLLGLLSHILYQRWSTPFPEERNYPVTFAPLPAAAPRPAEIPLVQARDVEKIRRLAGNHARVQGRIYRVGHSAKSNTYFLNFGPSRSSFTGVIFTSALDLFEKKKIHPKSFEGREVELTGEIRDHPKYGLEMVLEDPSQIRVLD